MIWFCTGNTCILYPINSNNEKSIINFKQKIFPLLANTTLVMNWTEVVCHGEEYWTCIRPYLTYRWLNYHLTPLSRLLRYVSLQTRTVIYQIRMDDARLYWFLSSQIFSAVNLTIWELLNLKMAISLKLKKHISKCFMNHWEISLLYVMGLKFRPVLGMRNVSSATENLF